jgi:hypothetical protein
MDNMIDLLDYKQGQIVYELKHLDQDIQKNHYLCHLIVDNLLHLIN